MQEVKCWICKILPYTEIDTALLLIKIDEEQIDGKKLKLLNDCKKINVELQKLYK